MGQISLNFRFFALNFKTLRSPCCLVMLGACLAHAQGGSAIITLTMPPPGGEGYSMLQDGGLFADGAVSAYYNPALLADLERNTGSQLHFANSHQDLLPVLRFDDITHQFTGLAGLLPDPVHGTDLGVGFFRNHVEFGENPVLNREGEIVDYLDSRETVWGAAVGLRLGMPVSLGVAAKFFDSYLTDYFLSSGERKRARASGWAFDIGMLANPRLSPAASLGLPWMEFAPSLSVSLKNMGSDAFYVDAEQADPLPRKLDLGFGIQARFFDAVDFEAATTQQKEIHRRASWGLAPVYINGYSISILCVRFSEAWLKDDVGKRDERHEGWALELDMLRLHRIWRRLATRDFTSPPAALDKGYPFAWTKVLGIPFRANPRLIFGRRKIDGRDKGVREGQEAVFMSLSL